MEIEEQIKFQKLLKNQDMRLDSFLNHILFKKGGYYYGQNPIGKTKDFTTAPEISQIFGEIIGIYLYYFWKTNINSNFNLVELGPGRGTLFIDIINCLSKYPEFLNKAKITLVEINQELIKLQKLKINNKLNLNINWNVKLNYKSKLPSLIYSNEFFDCFPVRQFIYNKFWFEKYVSLNQEEDRFFFKNKRIKNKKFLKYLDNFKDNKILEISFERNKYFEKICKFIKNNGGIFLTIDYGYLNKRNNFTLQGIQNHKFSNVLDDIGNKDISSHVNFNDLLEIALNYNLKIEEFSTQREFLIKYGIFERKKFFDNSSTYKNIEIDIERLIGKNKMGNLFKCFVVSNL